MERDELKTSLEEAKKVFSDIKMADGGDLTLEEIKEIERKYGIPEEAGLEKSFPGIVEKEKEEKKSK